jgi:hypothetical protein
MDPAVEMAFLVEMVVYRGVDSDEFLQGCVFFSQSLMQTLARSGSTKTGPFHGFIYTPFMKKVLHITERKRETNVHHYCKSDDFRAGFEVAKWGTFCH